MMMDPNTRLQDIGQDFSKARRLFRRLGLDMDAVEHLTISEACDRTGISFKDFERTLTAMTPHAHPTLEDWTQAPLPDLVRHIQERHHTYTRNEMTRLTRLMEEATEACGDAFPVLHEIRVHFQGLKEDLTRHLNHEDQVIFPTLKAGRTAQGATLEDLHRLAAIEHDAAEELFQNIGILTRNYTIPPQAPVPLRSLYLGLRDLEEDLFVHIYLENHILFPRAMNPVP